MSREEDKLGQDIIKLSQEKLDEEEIVKLVKKVLQEGKEESIHEARFILVLPEWKRPGNSFKDYGKFRILYGDAEIFELHSVYDYPTTDQTEYGIIPKSKAVVILFEWGDDFQGKFQKYAKLYVFTYHKGWESIDLY